MRSTTAILAKGAIRRQMHKQCAVSDTLKDHQRLEIAALTNLRHVIGISKSSRLPIDLV